MVESTQNKISVRQLSPQGRDTQMLFRFSPLLLCLVVCHSSSGEIILLKNGGELYIETDNINDFLMGIELDEFKQFFYRTAHYWYFDDSSLKKSLEIVGFKNIKVGFRHGYDLSNTLLWLRDRIPTGIGKIKIASLPPSSIIAPPFNDKAVVSV